MNTATKSLLDRATRICEAGEKEINAALVSGKKIGITQLSKDIASSLDMSFSNVYNILAMYVVERGDIVFARGPKGGLQRIPAVTPKVDLPPVLDPKFAA